MWDGAALFPYATGIPELGAAIDFAQRIRISSTSSNPVVTAMMDPKFKPEWISVPDFTEQTWPYLYNLGVVQLAEQMWGRSNDSCNFVRAFVTAVEEIGRAGDEPLSVVGFYKVENGNTLVKRPLDLAFFTELIESRIFNTARQEYVSRAFGLYTRTTFRPAPAYERAVFGFDKAVGNENNSAVEGPEHNDFVSKCKIIRCNFEPQLKMIYDLPNAMPLRSSVDVQRQLDSINALVYYALKYMETYSVGGDEIALPACYAVACKKAKTTAYAFCGPVDAIFRRQRNHLLVDTATLSDFTLSATDAADRAMLGSISEITWTGERFEMNEMMGAPHSIWIRRNRILNTNGPNAPSLYLPAVFEEMLKSIAPMDRVAVMRTYWPAGEMIDLKRYQQRVVCMDEIYKKHLLLNGFRYVAKKLTDKVRSESVVSKVKWFWRNKVVYYFIHTPIPSPDLKTRKHIVDIGLGSDIYFEREFAKALPDSF